MGDEISEDSLTKSLLIADDAHTKLMTENGNLPQIKDTKLVDFKLLGKIDHFERDKNALSRNQGLTTEVPMPKPDVSDNIIDPEEEEKNYQELVLKEKQKLEYEEAIKKDLEKREEEFKKAEEEKEKEFEQQKEQEAIKVQIEESKNKLDGEPDDDNSDVTTIQIRLADGNSVTRKFLKTSSIEQLYLYIRSLGEDAGFEEITADFELFQQSNKYTDFTKTIEEEGLFPRAKVYVREM
mmetsp:Transcript_17886/g.15796  ORF Transcript_17886/g.15796 Transcript_17886/m.15796 type:complete len:238 (-) Transcript_17886:2-715(-)